MRGGTTWRSAAVVSAGAKAILDLPRTAEMLETLGVLVVGFQTDEWLWAFETYVSREAGGSCFDDGRVEAFGRYSGRRSA